jgi:FkbM family methyltransferase
MAKLTSYRWIKLAASGRVNDLVNSINFKPYILSRVTAGEKYLFYVGSPQGKSWYGNAEDLRCIEMEFTRDHLIRPGGIVIECGAHHGCHSILLSRWVGEGGKVVVVEPMPENIAIIKRNIEINRLSNVIVMENAAGPNNMEVYMRKRSNSSVTEAKKGAISVPAVTLDSVAALIGAAPSFIKVDVEGFEYKVLEGAASVLSKKPAILLEVHTLNLHRYGNTFEDLWNFVDPVDYDIFYEDGSIAQPAHYSPGNSPPDYLHLYFKPRASGDSADRRMPDYPNA